VENKNDADPQVVEALQFYEEYDAKGVLKSKRLLELHFRLTRKEEFGELAKAAGFQVKVFYGDYSYSGFTADSPYRIWLLENVG
jgi:hypothetical protein